jgi:hypothetical protein
MTDLASPPSGVPHDPYCGDMLSGGYSHVLLAPQVHQGHRRLSPPDLSVRWQVGRAVGETDGHRALLGSSISSLGSKGEGPILAQFWDLAWGPGSLSS